MISVVTMILVVIGVLLLSGFGLVVLYALSKQLGQELIEFHLKRKKEVFEQMEKEYGRGMKDFPN